MYTAPRPDGVLCGANKTCLGRPLRATIQLVARVHRAVASWVRAGGNMKIYKNVRGLGWTAPRHDGALCGAEGACLGRLPLATSQLAATVHRVVARWVRVAGTRI